jgi:hypothetical protein
LLGPWLNDETTIEGVLAFTDRVYAKRDWQEFKGDREYLRSPTAQKTYGKLRVATAGLYAWRYGQAKSSSERAALKREADLAFLQAIVLCPYSPETVLRFCAWLGSDGRLAEARAVAQAATRIAPNEAYFKEMLASLNNAAAAPAGRETRE